MTVRVRDTDCRMCERPAKLLDSHILPDFAYREVIDKTAHPRMVVVRHRSVGRIVDKTQQTGFKERLLCETCEKKLNRYETYAAKNLFDAVASRSLTYREPVLLENLEYAPLKLFFLSFLWKASVSENNFFKCVNLGPHESTIKGMLYAENPGEPTEYGCLVSALLPEEGIDFSHTVAEPIQTRTDDHNGYVFSFLGLVFNFYISSHRISAPIRSSFLGKNGRMLVFPIRIRDVKPLRDLWNKCVKAGRNAPD